MENIQNLLYTFIERLTTTEKEYKKSKDISQLKTQLASLANDYREYFGIGDLFVAHGAQFVDNGDYEAGIVFMTTAHTAFSQIANTTTLYLRLAENEFMSGNVEQGKEYLIRFCTAKDNYEESAKINGLTDVWEKYRHYVQNDVPASMSFNANQNLLSPESCSMNINDILKLPKDDLLPAISEHLNELCGNGNFLNVLTASERTVYLIDQLITDVNSDGIEHYLTYNGLNFAQTQAAFREIADTEALVLMEKIQRKFPRSKVPTKDSSLQAVLEKMENKGIDFEQEEEFYYQHVENPTLELLYNYILENADDFR